MQTRIRGMVTGLLTGLVILGNLPALAGPFDANITRQEMNQERRIYQGVQSGQLTPWEFRRLENEQARLRAAETRMRADGRLSRKERDRLNRMLARSSQDIYALKHNRGRAVRGN